MAITISIVNAPAGARSNASSHVFSEQGGTIGRGEKNTWVLDDPEKYLSSCHCSISFERGHYYITDLSTNGTYLNRAPAPLGKGARSVLKDGDSFELGSYSMQVVLHASADLNSDIFGKSFSVPDPFAQPVNIPPDNFAFNTSGSFSSHTPSPFFEESSFEKEADSIDPLAALDKYNPQSTPFSPAIDAYQFSGSQQQGGSVISDAFNLPNLLPAENIIPEDWGDDDLMEDYLSAPVATASRRANIAPEVVVPQPPVSQSAKLTSTNIQQSPVRQPKTEAAPSNLHKTHSVNNAANSALVKAMGLEGLSPEEADKVAETVGELMPVIVDGVMKLLRSRASIKNEFRMNMTTIQPVENNPLKFSVSPKDALENMFVRKNSAYKDAIESFTEGFDGIVDHQIAIIAGMRAAFKGMMDRFDPEKLEKQFDKQSKGVTLPGMQKVKYWNSYAEHFASYAENMEQSFRHLFGDDFVQAYENQIFKLVSARRKATKNDQ